MKRNLLLLATLLFIGFGYSNTGNAQRVNEDSLRKVIAETKLDSVKVLSMRRLASYLLLHKQEDSAGLVMLNQAKELAIKNKFQAGICEVLLTEGNYRAWKNDWAGSISKYTELSNEADKLTDSTTRKRTKMIALNNIANIHLQNGDYTTALDYYFKSRDILESMKQDENSLATVYINIAAIYNVLEQDAKAEEYLQLISPLLDSSRPNIRYMYWQERQNLADRKKDEKMVKLAIDSLENGLKTSTLSKFQQMQYTITLHDMKGRYLVNYAKDYPAAINNFQSMLEIASGMDDRPQAYSAMYELGNVYHLMGDNSNAIKYLEDAYKGAKADQVNQIVFRSSKLLSEIHSKNNNNGTAYAYLAEAYSLNDSLNTRKNVEQLNFLEASYQNEKKEKEIAELNTVNTKNELTIVKRNRLLLITGITAIAVFLVLILLYRNSRQKQVIAINERKLKEDEVRFLERQQQVVSLQSMINGQETERTRIAKDLHDGLGGIFSTVKMHYSTLQNDTPLVKDNPLYKKTLDLINNASDELRRVAHNMMPEVLMKVGLVEALQDYCNNISSGKLLMVKLQTYGMDKRLSTSTEIMLYRITQELVNNIIKHASATEALIQINRDGNRLSLTIEDNGRGFDTREAEEKRSMGLETVKSRVDYLNGKLTIDSRKDVGTTVMIDILLNEN